MTDIFGAVTFRFDLGGTLGDASPYSGKATFILSLDVDPHPVADYAARATFALGLDMQAGGQGISQSLAAASQSLTPGDLVHLFEMTVPETGEVLYFTPGPIEGQTVGFGGRSYSYIPVKIEGFEWNGTGALTQPTLTVDAVSPAFRALVIGYGDLVGADVRYIKTFRQFLDGQPAADPTAHFPIETYQVARKTTQNNLFVAWSLRAPIDRQDVSLPRRVMYRDICPLRYRFWNPNLNGAGQGGFDYSKATCPYHDDTKLFLATDAATADPTLDVCGKRLRSCEARYGTADKPFGGFPGIALYH